MPWWYRSRSAAARNSNNTPCANLGSSSSSNKHPADSIRNPNSNAGVWTWLTNRRSPSAPDQLGSPQHLSPAENHYTHMDDAYSPVGAAGEALYAELDRESINSNNPSYQNTAYSQCGDMVRRVTAFRDISPLTFSLFSTITTFQWFPRLPVVHIIPISQ